MKRSSVVVGAILLASFPGVVPASAASPVLGRLAEAGLVAGDRAPVPVVSTVAITEPGPEWTILNEGPTASGTFERGPSGPPLGAGSFRQQLTDGADRQTLRTTVLDGTLLSAITELGYSTFVAANQGGQASALRLMIDLTGDGVYTAGDDDALVFEPVYQTGYYGGDTVPNQCPGVSNCVAIGDWQHWDADEGGWWSQNAGTFVPPLVTLTSYVADNPTATLVTGVPAVRLQAGSGPGSWDDFDGNVDAVNLQGVTYDLDPAAPSVICVPSVSIDPSCDLWRPTLSDAYSYALGFDTIMLDGLIELTSPIVIAKDDLTIRSVDGEASDASTETIVRMTGTNPPGDGILRVTGSRNRIEGIRFEDETDRPGGADPDHVTLKLEGDANIVDSNAFGVPVVFRPPGGETCAGGDFSIQLRAEAGSDGVASGNEIVGNLFEGGCRAVAAVYSGENRRADDTTIANNSITGPGIALDGGGKATITGNTLTAATLLSGSGIYCRAKDDPDPLSAEPNHSVAGTLLSGNVVSGYRYGAYLQGCGGVESSLDRFAGNDEGVHIMAEGPNTGAPTFTRDRFEGNLTWGVTNMTGVTVSAERSWWGDPSGPSGAGGGSGDDVSVDVDYSPWYLDEALTTLASFDEVVDCDIRTDDLAAIQAIVNEMVTGGTLALSGACDVSAALPYTEPTAPYSLEIDAAAIVVPPNVRDVEITSVDLTDPATIVGSGTQVGFYVAPGNVGTTISALRFVNLARAVVVHNATGTTIGGGTNLPDVLGNRVLGGASTDAGIMAIGRTPSQTEVAYGANGASTLTIDPSGPPLLSGLDIVGNYVSLDPPGPVAVGIDVRTENAGGASGITIERNAIGLGGTTFVTSEQLGIKVWGHSGDGHCHISDVAIDANNLGRLEELTAAPGFGNDLADLRSTGRIGIMVNNTCGFSISGNGIRSTMSATPGLDMPGGGIIISNSQGLSPSEPAEVSENGIIVLSDDSTLPAHLGAIGIVSRLSAVLGGTGDGVATRDIRVGRITPGNPFDGRNWVGSYGDTVGPPQARGVVVTGATRVTVTNVQFEAVSDKAITIGHTIRGPGYDETETSVTPQPVSASTFCGNVQQATLDPALVPVPASAVRFIAGIGSSGNQFPGGHLYSGNGRC